MHITVGVNQHIFERFWTFRRGIVVAEGLNNFRPRPQLAMLLESVIEKARSEPIDLSSDAGSVLWNRAHEAFGSNPNRFPPSHIAMRKRLQSGKAIPFISPIVAIMNVNSLTSHTSVGGDDIDYVGKQLELRFANGNETFVPLFQQGADEHPQPGEVIYVDEAGWVMCRRWNWRNSHMSRIRDETRNLVMNIDGLGDDCETMVIRTRDRVAEMLNEFCDARVTTALLSPETPKLEFAVTACPKPV